MSERVIPAPPNGLQAAGKSLWRAIQAALDDGFEFDDREGAILGLACRQADDVARLERALKREGLIVAGSQGQRRLSAIVAELRQGRLAVARLLGELELPTADEQPRTARSKRAQHAAGVRWANVAAMKERARGA